MGAGKRIGSAECADFAEDRELGLNVNNPADYALLTSKLNSPQAIAAGFKAPYAGYSLGNTVAQSLRPYPQFGDIGINWAPLGDSWYDSLQAKITKRFSRGLDVTANYTFSKNLATAEDQDGTTIPTNDVFNRRLNKTLSRNDQPHIFVVAFNYIVPGWNRTFFSSANYQRLDSGRDSPLFQRHPNPSALGK